MKIDVTDLYGGIRAGDDLLKRDLFWYLYAEVYGKPSLPTGDLLWFGLRHIVIDLQQMAAMLRKQDWCVYYWRDRYGLDGSDDWHTRINYGRREGLIIGRYCPNLTAWLLSHT